MAGPTKTRRVKAIRQFRYQGESLAVGSVIEPDRNVAQELVVNRKAVFVEATEPLKRLTELAPPSLEKQLAERRARAAAALGHQGPTKAEVDAYVEEQVQARLGDAVAKALEAALPGAVEKALEAQQQAGPDKADGPEKAKGGKDKAA